MAQILSSLKGLFSQNSIPHDADLAKNPERLASLVRPVCTKMLARLNYQGAPQLQGEAVEALLEYMYNRAVQIGVPLDTPISEKAFRMGLAFGLLAYPGNPVEVQGYVGIITWLVVVYEDTIEESKQMLEDTLLFQPRFFRGEPQANKLLEGLASTIREAHVHFDCVVANLLQASLLDFMTSNLLEWHDNFQNIPITGMGKPYPEFCRELSGISVGYAVLAFPKALYPDVGTFLEAVPDMANFISFVNDVLSFYKEELKGDTRNYIHGRAACMRKPALAALEEVKNEVVDSARRIDAILRGSGEYAHAWNGIARGYIAMHIASPRYKLKDLGIQEESPLAPFEGMISQFFEQIRE